MPRSSDKGVPGEEARAPSSRGAGEKSRAAVQRAPSSLGLRPRKPRPPSRRPAPTDLAELLALGELLEGVALCTLGAGVQGRGRHPAPQSPPLLHRRPLRGGALRGTRAPPPLPPPGPRAPPPPPPLPRAHQSLGARTQGPAVDTVSLRLHFRPQPSQWRRPSRSCLGPYSGGGRRRG